MKVSHEVPISMMTESRSFNDYDYALVHLFETHPKYYEFFEESLLRGREVYLDNSLFELREEFDMDRFAYWIKKLGPTKYFIPDALYDTAKTLSNVKTWNLYYKDKVPGKAIGVVQGKTFRDLARCYNVLTHTVDEIAFNKTKEFDFSYGSFNEDWNISMKRVRLINELLAQDLIETDMKHHLLGCQLPQEFKFYKDMSWITSCDTSSPIVHGLLLKKYHENGLDKKEEVLLADLIDVEPTKKQRKYINFNIKKFREFTN